MLNLFQVKRVLNPDVDIERILRRVLVDIFYTAQVISFVHQCFTLQEVIEATSVLGVGRE